MTPDDGSATLRKNEFLSTLLEAATRLTNDPFSETTRTRQRYLLISSILTLAFTFSVFELKKLSVGIAEGEAHISSAHLACIFAVTTVYLVLLFLVGAIQELGLRKLQRRHFDKEVDVLDTLRLLRYLQTARLTQQMSDLTLDLLPRGPRTREAERMKKETIQQISSAMEESTRRKMEGASEESLKIFDDKVTRLMDQLIEQSRSLIELYKNESPEQGNNAAPETEKDESARKATERRLEDEIREASDLEMRTQLQVKDAKEISAKAGKYFLYRAIIEITLPALFGWTSVVLCFRTTHCLTSILHTLRTAF